MKWYQNALRAAGVWWDRLKWAVREPMGFFYLWAVVEPFPNDDVIGKSWGRRSSNEWVPNVEWTGQYVARHLNEVVYRIPHAGGGPTEDWGFERFGLEFRLPENVSVGDLHLYRIAEPDVDLGGQGGSPIVGGRGGPFQVDRNYLWVHLPENDAYPLHTGVAFVLRWTDPQTGDNHDLVIRSV